MLANYIKMTLRNLTTQLAFSIINVSGLALGLASCILILLFVRDELSYDKHHEKAEQIYRLCANIEVGGSSDPYASKPFAVAPAFTNGLPEIKTFTRLFYGDGQLIYKDKHFDEEKVFFADTVFMTSRNPDLFSGFFLSLKINADTVSETIEYIKQKWEEFDPGRPLDYYFVDEDFASKYNAEEKVGSLIGVFAVLGLLIAALRLFGMASFMAERRVKEIGIRKVLGASVTKLLILISNEFAILVIISNIIAWPVAYWVMTDYWLINFPYRVSPGVFVFVISGLLSIFITLMAVGYQAIRAASMNPVESLRYE